MVASAFGEDGTGGCQSRLTVDDLKYLFMMWLDIYPYRYIILIFWIGDFFFLGAGVSGLFFLVEAEETGCWKFCSMASVDTRHEDYMNCLL